MPATAPPEYVPLVEVVRSGFREGVHYGTVAGLTASGMAGATRGAPDAPVLPRSAAKPFQALAALRAGAPITGEQIAVAAGSHNGENIHTETVRAILTGAGLGPADLQCPADRPLGPAAREELVRTGGEPTPLLMNCSGKHAAMLSACVQQGWDTGSYLDPQHPLQRLVRDTIEELCGEPVAHTTVDGCGAPQLAVSLEGLARGLQAMVHAAENSAEAAVVRAMRDFPTHVAGEGRDDTTVMRRLPGTVSKIGAEGVIAVATATGETAAVKISDGDATTRARTMVALSTLAELGVDTTPVSDLLSTDLHGGGRPVGSIRPMAPSST